MKTKAEKKPAAMNYFAAIAKRVEEIDKLAADYLAKFEFLPNDVIISRIHKVAWVKFRAANEDFDKIPEWAASIVDGWPPFTGYLQGSIYDMLGTSVVSVDAHLRNLLERAEGRETKELDFPILAEKAIVERWSGLA